MKNRARLKILGFIMGFCTYRSLHGTPMTGELRNSFQYKTPEVGDLVILGAVIDPGEWYLSWVTEVVSENEAVLESIETGVRCRWYNISFSVFKEPQEWWRWDDNQFRFYDWCVRASKGFMFSAWCSFDGDKVTIKTRGRYGLEKYTRELAFEDYKKLKYRDVKKLMNGIETT